MRIELKTKVNQNYKSVFKGFTASLFLQLKPPLLPLKLRKFDGCMKGDEVKITLGAGFLSQDWDALIIDQGESEEEIYFVDKGVKLPFFLKTWEHRHRILKDGENAIIIDDFSYTTPFLIMDYLMYPIMYLQFALRGPVYKKVFA